MKKLASLLVLGFLMVLLVGCSDTSSEPPAPTVTVYIPPAAQPTMTPVPAPTEPPPTVAPTEPPTTAPMPALPPGDLATWTEDIAQEINVARGSQGLPAYTYNDLLEIAAQLQANDCSQRGSCSNEGSDGSDVKTRVQQAGYTMSAADACWAISGTPRGAVDWMLNAATTDWPRQLLLSDEYVDVGIGVATAPDWGYYFVVVVGAP